MIRRSPAEKYLQYLILHPKRYDNAKIKEIVRYVQLDFLGDWYLEKLRGKLAKKPDPFFPNDQSHRPSRQFLLSNGLSWLFHTDEHGKKAFDILERPRVKEFVESMILSGAPHLAIAYGVSKQFRFKIGEKVIDRYRDFFWNIDLLDSTEVRAILQLRVDLLENDQTPEIAAQHKAVRNAFYRDARKTAADLPASPVSSLIAQMRIGVSPSKIDVLKIVERTSALASLRAYEATHNNGKGDSGRALEFSQVMRNLAEVVEKISHPEDNLREQLATIAMRTDDASLPSIHQLSQGRHTAEVVVMEKTNALPADFDDGDAGDELAGDPG